MAFKAGGHCHREDVSKVIANLSPRRDVWPILLPAPVIALAGIGRRNLNRYGRREMTMLLDKLMVESCVEFL